MLYTAHYQSKFGWFQIKGSYLGIQSIKLVDEKGEDSYPMPEILISCVQQLDEYFHRKRQEFKLHLDWEGKSAFHQAVWKELLKIPYGHTTTYSAIAEKLDNPQAVRAVGLANRNNPHCNSSTLPQSYCKKRRPTRLFLWPGYEASITRN